MLINDTNDKTFTNHYDWPTQRQRNVQRSLLGRVAEDVIRTGCGEWERENEAAASYVREMNRNEGLEQREEWLSGIRGTDSGDAWNSYVRPSDAEWHGAAGSEPLRCNCGAIVPPGRPTDGFCRECTLPFDHTWQYSRGADRGQPCFPKGTIVTSTIQWLRLLLCVSRYHLLSVLSPQESCDLQARPLGHALTVLLEPQPWQLEVIPTKSNTEPTMESINTEVNT